MTDSGLEDEVQKLSFKEMVIILLYILLSYLKTNKNTTNSLYNRLNNIKEFFKNQNKKH